MAEQELGASFAINGGGSYLAFPHHETEIASPRRPGDPSPGLEHNGWSRRGRRDVEIRGNTSSCRSADRGRDAVSPT